MRARLGWLLPFAVTLAGLGLAVIMWRGAEHEMRPVTLVATALTFTAALATCAMVAYRGVALRLVVVLSQIAGAAVFVGLRAVDRWPFENDTLHDARYAALLTTAIVVTGLGLALRKPWARWVGLAFAVSAVACGLLNSTWLVYGLRGEHPWVLQLGTISGAILWIQLAHPAMREHCKSHAVWTSRAPLVRTARWAAIANLITTAMLVLYALGQPVTPATTTFALVLAPFTLLGGALVMARKIAGVLVLGVSGVALAVLAARTLAPVATTDELLQASYYAAFWLAAAALGLVATALVVLARLRPGPAA
jgi:hypothetical protein